MLRKFHASVWASGIAAVLLSQAVMAQTPQELLAEFSSEAKAAAPAFQGFSAAKNENVVPVLTFQHFLIDFTDGQTAQT